MRCGLAALFLLVAACRPFPKHRDGVSETPHVFIIVIDTLRWDRLGLYGRTPSYSPSLDLFAEDAVVYPRAYAQSSWTKTSVASLLTGVYPYRHRVFEESIPDGRLPQSARTMAERLKEKGYRTLAVSVNPHVSKQAGFGQGFDSFVNQKKWSTDTSEFATQSLIRHLKTSNPLEPHFVYLHYLDPHDPWPPRPQCQRFIPQPAVKMTNAHVRKGRPFSLSGEGNIKNLQRSGKVPRPVPLSSDELAYLQSLYGCEIALVDHEVGDLVAYLKKGGWLDHAIVVITADHGEEFLDHGMLRHGYQLFDETVHVPLVIKTFPEMRIERPTSKTVVELVDVAATIYALLGIKTEPGELDGNALFDALGAPAPGNAPRAFGMTRFRKQHRAYLMSDHLKVINDFKNNSCVLYDVAKDPLERKPSACDASPEGKEMRSALMTLKADTSAKAFMGNGPVEPSARDDVVTEQLKELGYVR